MRDPITRRGLLGLLTGRRAPPPRVPVPASAAPPVLAGFDLEAFYRARTACGAPGEPLPEIRLRGDLATTPVETSHRGVPGARRR
jgi:hypothetical protein